MTVQIKVNVINEMKKLRTVVYGDRLAWVEELIQNTQRAGATRVDITVSYDKFKIEDNGKGCTSPQVLFEKSQSGWSGEIDSQNPFGEGFFSTIMVANMIRVKSVGFVAEFDVRKMFEQNTVDCISVKGSARKSGFIVELEDLEDEYSTWSVESRVVEVAQFIRGIQFYLNGKLIEHKSFTDTDGSPYAITVKTDKFEGWLRPFVWGSDGYKGDAYSLYAQERKVKENYLTGVKGLIHVKNGILDLRSPDRKDVVHNDKYTQFNEAVRQEIKSVMHNLLQTAGDSDIDKYADVVDRHLSPEEYERYMRFVVTTDLVDFDKLVEKIEEKKEKGEKFTFDQVAEEVAFEQQEVIEEMEIRNEPVEFTPTVSAPVKQKQAVVRTGRESLGERQMFWVKVNDLDLYEDKISLAQYHDIPLVLVRNKLEEKVLEGKSNFLHIDQLNEKVELSAQLKKVGAVDEVEERALWLFGVICKGLGFDRNIFRIGDMTTFKETKIGDTEKVVEEAPALALANGVDIYVDRGCLKKENLEVSKSNRITNADRAFIVRNLEVIAHELAHIMYFTTDNTKEHEVAQRQITHKILEGLF